MVKHNPYLEKLSRRYLFDIEIDRKNLIDLSIGDTSEPLSATLIEALQQKVQAMGTKEGYQGYGPCRGEFFLREKIAKTFYTNITPEEIFISDGAKCDVARLQHLFAPKVVALQNPAYPVYRDLSVLQGVEEIVDLPCTPENDFFPSQLPRADLFYICSPNNPTGTVLTKAQLQKAVQHAKKERACILFDAAYSSFIQDPSLPRTIYEIEGAKEVAIEINSFSKMAGFTGLRLGWSVVPRGLCDEEGHSLYEDWQRITATCFNGASLITQAAGAVAGAEHIDYYLENARLLQEAFAPFVENIYGGEHVPFLWIKAPIWESLYKKCGILAVAGEGFGSEGKGFIRLSAFGKREKILEACTRLEMHGEHLLEPSLQL